MMKTRPDVTTLRQSTLAIALTLGACEEGKEIARIPLHELGEPNAVGVLIDGGTPVSFSVSADDLVHHGRNYLRLKIEFLDRNEVKTTFECRGFHVEAGSGTERKPYQHRDECATLVPVPRTDTIRVTATNDRPSRMDLTRMVIGVRLDEDVD